MGTFNKHSDQVAFGNFLTPSPPPPLDLISQVWADCFPNWQRRLRCGEDTPTTCSGCRSEPCALSKSPASFACWRWLLIAVGVWFWPSLQAQNAFPLLATPLVPSTAALVLPLYWRSFTSFHGFIPLFGSRIVKHEKSEDCSPATMHKSI